ncbi:MAG: ribosome maturation factor RimM [Acidobacteria bacterium]|nr:ribosome maturation factor RimM [Acidobacteriota bacterium]MCY3966855.1 ribosome maturation factor RimM [Acidobacteriota bacterium]
MEQSPRSTRRDEPEMVAVGSVLRAHGLRGEVLVLPDSENPARFRSGSELFVRDGGRLRRLEVESSRSHRGRELVQFVDVRDRDGAEGLRGALLEAPEESVPAAEEGTFYYFQLVGCRVVDRALGDLGEVTEVVEDGGGVLLSVTRPPGGDGGREVLIPFAHRLLPEINVEERLIRSDLPPGLLEACGSTS